MPIFYFDVLEVDGQVTEDQVGVDLPSAEAAKRQADTALAEMTAEEIRKGTDFKIRIRTRKQDGKEIASRQSEVSRKHFDDDR